MGNYLKTILLLGVLSVILITLGGVLGGQQGLYTALIIAFIMNGVSYFYSDKIVLSMSGAKPLDRKKAPELYEVVEELTQKMILPMPKLYLTPASQANAFATGRDPQHASVAVTEGLLNLLPAAEVKAVLAHELAHIKNRDILIATIAAVFASAISFMANMSFHNRGSDREDRGNSLFALLAIIAVPITASLVQLAISREREFGADADGAKTIGSGKSLVKALVAIHQSAQQSPITTSPALASLYIENPLGNSGTTLLKLFSTHPPLEERIKRLEKI